MYYTGFADEAARGITGQIEATKKLGWKWIESRAVDGVNIHDLPEEKFEAVAAELEASGVGINCFGSAVANWGWDPVKEEDFKATVEQLKRALVRMKRLNCKMIRGMSFRAQWNRPPGMPRSKRMFSARSNFWSECARRPAFSTCMKTATITVACPGSIH